MKRIFALLLAVCTLACLFTACGSGKTGSKEYNMKDVVAKIEETAPVASAMELSSDIKGSDDYLTDYFGVKREDVDSYYGKMTQINVKSDVILMVKAVSGKADTVKAALEAKRDALAASFQMYLTSEYDKAINGRVVEKGDYVLLVVAGDSDRIAEGKVSEVYAEIDKAIDAALQ